MPAEAEAEAVAPEPVEVAVAVVVVARWSRSLGSGATTGSQKPRGMVTAKGKVIPKEMATGSTRATHR